MIEPQDGKTYWVSINGGKPFLADYRVKNKDKHGHEAGPAWWVYNGTEEVVTSDEHRLTIIRELVEPVIGERPNDGGPAFLGRDIYEVGLAGAGVPMFRQGMSLRDWFAGRVISAAVYHDQMHVMDDDEVRDYARLAYRIADAMIVERESGR